MVQPKGRTVGPQDHLKVYNLQTESETLLLPANELSNQFW
jgi:hypothetical protein